ncbi:MAG: pentapeptide repeat-containing protein [Pseudomonadota bacterium]
MTDILESQSEQPNKRHWSLIVLDYTSRAGIIFVVLAFITEQSYRHIERTQDSFQLIKQEPPQSAPAAMALEYLNQEVTFPLCPLKKTCSLRTKMEFDNLNLYDADKDFGVHLDKDNLKSQDLRNATFTKSNLQKIVISDINLENSTFTDTNLKNSQFWDVNLKCARFSNSDLSGAAISFFNIKGAEFINTNISNIKLLGDAKQAGLHAETFAAAWVWRDEEPKGLTSKYRTYAVCEKPSDFQKGVHYSKPDTYCVRRNPIQQVQRNVCQVVEASNAIDWFDEQLSAVRDLF